MGPHVEILHLREDPQVPGTGCGGGFALVGQVRDLCGLEVWEVAGMEYRKG